MEEIQFGQKLQLQISMAHQSYLLRVTVLYTPAFLTRLLACKKISHRELQQLTGFNGHKEVTTEVWRYSTIALTYVSKVDLTLSMQVELHNSPMCWLDWYWALLTKLQLRPEMILAIVLHPKAWHSCMPLCLIHLQLPQWRTVVKTSLWLGLSQVVMEQLSQATRFF